jgi:hypothetical protein
MFQDAQFVSQFNFELHGVVAQPQAPAIAPLTLRHRAIPKMSSGFGFKGREGRCYRFWKDVEQCSVRGACVTTPRAAAL